MKSFSLVLLQRSPEWVTTHCLMAELKPLLRKLPELLSEKRVTTAVQSGFLTVLRLLAKSDDLWLMTKVTRHLNTHVLSSAAKDPTATPDHKLNKVCIFCTFACLRVS